MIRGKRVWAIGLLILSQATNAQEARLSVSVDSVFVGERFELRVAIEHSAGSSVTFQEVPEDDPEIEPLLSFGDAEVFSARRLPPQIDGAVRVDSVVYAAATFAMDEAVAGPVVVDIVVEGDTSYVRSNTVTLPVRSVLPSEEADLQPPGPPMSFPSPLLAWLVIVGGVVCLAALLIWLWLRLRGRSGSTKPRLVPYAEATERLQSLRIPEKESDVKGFYVELSDLLRTYLSRTLGVPALEVTTRELTDSLTSDERVPEAALKNIRGTLRVADLVKFADMRPDTDAHATAAEKTRTAVELVEALAHPPDTEGSEDPAATPQLGGDPVVDNGSQSTGGSRTSPNP